MRISTEVDRQHDDEYGDRDDDQPNRRCHRASLLPLHQRACRDPRAGEAGERRATMSPLPQRWRVIGNAFDAWQMRGIGPGGRYRLHRRWVISRSIRLPRADGWRLGSRREGRFILIRLFIVFCLAHAIFLYPITTEQAK